MSDDFNTPGPTVSQVVYDWLLLAYPKRHRETYGSEMRQLFKDQYRDAWNESRGWGVTKLWLNVLPDLVNSSIIERIAALKESKSMFDKRADLSSFRGNSSLTTFFVVFTIVFLLVFLSSVAITFILPKTYASTALVLMRHGTSNDNGVLTNDDSAYFIQTSVTEAIQSPLVLDRVVEKLNLNVVWGNKNNNKVQLKTAETRDLLKNRLILEQKGNSGILSITAYSDDRNEAAQIANAVFEANESYWVGVHETRDAKLSEDMDRESDALRTNKILQAKANVDLFNKDLKLLNAKLLAMQMQNARSNVLICMPLINPAEPEMYPVRPNKPLNAAIGLMAGIFLGLIAGGIAVLITLRGRKPSGPAPAAV